ncbi:porin [Methyloraptor flagellatus]|uniref:Porin n=1 Tax=Methyloraptor flagellatus TaxID=3162530 RepID=A0AAU7XIP8_9HYPH
MNLKLATMAAAFAGVATAAQAADLGRPAPAAVDYVKVCDAYGAGFFYIPGSDTCLKIGGFVLADLRTGGGKLSRFDSTASSFGDRTRSGNVFYTRARTQVNFDARTNTEFGLLRSYIDARWEVNTGATAVTTVLPAAYIQFGGLTAGLKNSAFDFTKAGYSLGADYQTNAYSSSVVNQLGYTFAFGNGISATVSIEDPTSVDPNMSGSPRRVQSTNAATTYGGMKVPDVVANLAVSQAWGSAQIAAAYHQDYGTFRSADGWAIAGGVEVLLPMIAKGDKIYVTAAYADGAVSYASQLGNATGRVKEVALNGTVGSDFVDDGIAIRKTKTWSVNGGFHHEFNPKWEFNFDAGYVNVDGFGTRDYSFVGVGGDIRWKPVSNMYIALDAEYGSLSYSTGTQALLGTSKKTYDGWTTLVRVRRNF